MDRLRLFGSVKMHITSKQTNGFGAAITGLNLSEPLSSSAIADVRNAWLVHRVLSFPAQPLTHDQFAQFTRYFGNWGNDPYVKTIDEHDHIIEVKREPSEKASPFGAAWHSDWSFQAEPPSATLLHAKIVPPVGGETWYADGYAAFAALDAGLQTELMNMTAIHSARRPYSPQGFLAGGGKERTMAIQPNEDANAIQEHPVVRRHPETGRPVLWINLVYTLSIKELSPVESKSLLTRLFAHQIEERFLYKHQWKADMLTMWDNRCVIHCAQGGYDGHRRVMHRTTVAGDEPTFASVE